ncbi:MAG: hypothetical protein PHQ65_11340 [Bacteroidales bacterium]|nr:hypothetical protein [Bacteroidales bacterium]MDD3665849.1 hypothetical protein [Bacteroidales bacterium]
MMHKISMWFPDFEYRFTPFYSDGPIDYLAQKGILDFTVLAGKFRSDTENYLRKNNLKIDYKGSLNNYELVVTCQDLIVPRNIRDKKIVLIQEGMTDPETLLFHLVRGFKLPRWIASTAATGLSDSYNLFYVASEGYKNLFIKKGVNPEKIRVTGIPNFDNSTAFLRNNFPYKNYILAATSDRRETYNFENRIAFLKKVRNLACGRQVIIKLHPNEKVDRATREIKSMMPRAIVFSEGNIGEMIANCDVLVTRYSSVVYIGLALGKKVYSDFDLQTLISLQPIQNNGSSARIIAESIREEFGFAPIPSLCEQNPTMPHYFSK